MEKRYDYTQLLYERYKKHNSIDYGYNGIGSIIMSNDMNLKNAIKTSEFKHMQSYYENIDEFSFIFSEAYRPLLGFPKDNDVNNQINLFPVWKNALYVELDNTKLLILSLNRVALLDNLDVINKYFLKLKKAEEINQYLPIRISLSLDNERVDIEKSYPNETAQELKRRFKQAEKEIKNYVPKNQPELE